MEKPRITFKIIHTRFLIVVTSEDDAVIVLQSIGQQIWKTRQWPQDQKGSIFILVPKKGNAKEC